MHCVDNSCTSTENTVHLFVFPSVMMLAGCWAQPLVRQTAQNKQFQQQHTGYLHIYNALTQTHNSSHHRFAWSNIYFEFNYLQFRYSLFSEVNFLTKHAIKVIIENSISTFPSKNICWWWKTLYYCIDANFCKGKLGSKLQFCFA